MPLPAGSGLDRRTFLTKTAGIALAVYGAGKLPPGLFDEGIARAQGAPSPILVSVFLEGGADSLSMLFPAGHPQYATLRPQLALPPGAGTAFSEDTSLRWHPSLAPLAELHGEGKVTVLPAVGYTNADQSHFTSRHYWEVGATEAGLAHGLARAATWTSRGRWTTRCRAWRSRTRSSLRSPPQTCRSRPCPRWTTTASGRTACGATSRTGCSTRSDFTGGTDPAAKKAANVTTQAARLRNQLTPYEDGNWRHSGRRIPPATIPSPDACADWRP